MMVDDRSIASYYSSKKAKDDEDRPFWETDSFLENSIELSSLCEPSEEFRGPLHWKNSENLRKLRPPIIATHHEDDEGLVEQEEDESDDDDYTEYFAFGRSDAAAAAVEKYQRRSPRTIFLLGLVLLGMSIISFAVTEVLLNSFGLKSDQIIHSNLPALENEQYAIRTAEIRKVLSRIISADDSFDLDSSSSSPQAEALHWITHQDLLQLHAKSSNLVQRFVLAVLYHSTSPKGWNNRYHWLSAKHECEWNDGGGIRACTADQEVVDISLWNNLQGTLPREVGYLSKLQVLYLARNKLKGTIPTEIGMLTALTYLGLQHNSFHGTFPTAFVGNLTKLKTVYLERNDFTGTILRGDPLCQLKKDAIPGIGGCLQQLTGDCKTFVEWKQPELTCSCCTKCYPPS